MQFNLGRVGQADSLSGAERLCAAGLRGELGLFDTAALWSHCHSNLGFPEHPSCAPVVVTASSSHTESLEVSVLICVRVGSVASAGGAVPLNSAFVLANPHVLPSPDWPLYPKLPKGSLDAGCRKSLVNDDFLF